MTTPKKVFLHFVTNTACELNVTIYKCQIHLSYGGKVSFMHALSPLVTSQCDSVFKKQTTAQKQRHWTRKKISNKTITDMWTSCIDRLGLECTSRSSVKFRLRSDHVCVRTSYRSDWRAVAFKLMLELWVV